MTPRLGSQNSNTAIAVILEWVRGCRSPAFITRNKGLIPCIEVTIYSTEPFGLSIFTHASARTACHRLVVRSLPTGHWHAHMPAGKYPTVSEPSAQTRPRPGGPMSRLTASWHRLKAVSQSRAAEREHFLDSGDSFSRPVAS